MNRYRVPACFEVTGESAQDARESVIALMELLPSGLGDADQPGYVLAAPVGNLDEVVDLGAYEEDDDPQCAYCGVYRSEHRLLGCQEGFVTPDQLRAERQAIYEQVRRESDDYRDYDDDEPHCVECGDPITGDAYMHDRLCNRCRTPQVYHIPGSDLNDYDEPPVDDGFPMSLEYDGMWGGSDLLNEQTAQREAEHERELFGGEQ